MSQEPGFTAKQLKVYEQVCDLLHEHFNATFLAVQAEADDDERSEVKSFDYHGGMSACIGLVRIGSLTMEHDAISRYTRRD